MDPPTVQPQGLWVIQPAPPCTCQAGAQHIQLQPPSYVAPANAWVQVEGQSQFQPQSATIPQAPPRPSQHPPIPPEEQRHFGDPTPAQLPDQPQPPPKRKGGRIGGRGYGCNDYGYRICTQIMIYANRHKMGNQELSQLLGIPASSAGSIYLRFKKLANSRDLNVQLDTVDAHFNVNPKAHRKGRPKGIEETHERVRGVRNKKVTRVPSRATPPTVTAPEPTTTTTATD